MRVRRPMRLIYPCPGRGTSSGLRAILTTPTCGSEYSPLKYPHMPTQPSPFLLRKGLQCSLTQRLYQPSPLQCWSVILVHRKSSNVEGQRDSSNFPTSLCLLVVLGMNHHNTKTVLPIEAKPPIIDTAPAPLLRGVIDSIFSILMVFNTAVWI